MADLWCEIHNRPYLFSDTHLKNSWITRVTYESVGWWNKESLSRNYLFPSARRTKICLMGQLNTKKPPYQWKHSYYEDEVIMRPFDLYNRNASTGKITFNIELAMDSNHKDETVVKLSYLYKGLRILVRWYLYTELVPNFFSCLILPLTILLLTITIILIFFNTLRPRQKGRHFADDIFKCIFVNENIWNPTEISLKFIPRDQINNILALV